MSSNSWSLKTIRTTIVLGEDTFKGGGNTKVIEGLATDVHIEKNGMPTKNTAEIVISGMKYEDLVQITTVGFKPREMMKNAIVIEAGEQGGDLTTVFSGEITTATADFSGAPEITMAIKAMTGAYGSLTPAPPVSVQGEAAAADLIESFAKEMGYEFRNEGITARVKNAIFSGSALMKARRVADQVGCELILDNGVMIILDPEKPRDEGKSVAISKETGLIGYPTITDDGIELTTGFNPNVQYGGKITVESIVPLASGEWKITNLKHSLSAYHSSGGTWVTEIHASPINATTGGVESMTTISDNGTGANVGR